MTEAVSIDTYDLTDSSISFKIQGAALTYTLVYVSTTFSDTLLEFGVQYDYAFIGGDHSITPYVIMYSSEHGGGGSSVDLPYTSDPLYFRFRIDSTAKMVWVDKSTDGATWEDGALGFAYFFEGDPDTAVPITSAKIYFYTEYLTGMGEYGNGPYGLGTYGGAFSTELSYVSEVNVTTSTETPVTDFGPPIENLLYDVVAVRRS